MPAPTVTDALAYLVTVDATFALDPDTVADAFAAEKAAQARRCRVPADDAAWPADLAQALCRRVGVNLARRPNLLGFVPSVDPAVRATYLPATDSEVRRLEAPHRKLVIG